VLSNGVVYVAFGSNGEPTWVGGFCVTTRHLAQVAVFCTSADGTGAGLCHRVRRSRSMRAAISTSSRATALNGTTDWADAT